jgi:hypothetical protein
LKRQHAEEREHPAWKNLCNPGEEHASFMEGLENNSRRLRNAVAGDGHISGRECAARALRQKILREKSKICPSWPEWKKCVTIVVILFFFAQKLRK